LLAGAEAPTQLPDGYLPEQGGDHATAVVVRKALQSAAGAGPVEGACLVELVLHEAQLQAA